MPNQSWFDHFLFNCTGYEWFRLAGLLAMNAVYEYDLGRDEFGDFRDMMLMGGEL